MRILFCLCVVLLTGNAASEAARSLSARELSPLGKFSVEGNLHDGMNISGIAAAGAGQALVVGDEGFSAQLISIDTTSRTIRPLRLIKLISGGELDAEGVAIVGGSYYVTGSHGLGRKSGMYEKSRYHIVQVSPSGTSSAGTLSGILTSDTVLARYFRKPLQGGGINIEGLAGMGGQLYAGLRGPARNGQAFILAFSPQTALAGGSSHHLHTISLPRGHGIRSLAEAGDHLMVLTGASSPNSRTPSRLFLWSPAGATRELGTLTGIRGKPEALLVLSSTAQSWKVLVFSDGIPNGDPALYEVPKQN